MQHSVLFAWFHKNLLFITLIGIIFTHKLCLICYSSVVQQKFVYKKGMFVAKCMLKYSHSLGVKLNLQIFFFDLSDDEFNLKNLFCLNCDPIMLIFLMENFLIKTCITMQIYARIWQIKVMKNVNKGFMLFEFWCL